jgi:hypothetical protein
MSRISKRDVHVLLDAGFSEEDLGLVEGGFQGVEIYETPDDYFARELIENACEKGECALYDESFYYNPEKNLPYDTSRPSIYDNQEYAGNDDYLEDTPVNVREQALMVKDFKFGKISLWQRKNKHGKYEWPVTNLRVIIPEEDKERYEKLSEENKKELWKKYARDEWKHLWETVLLSLKYEPIEEILEFVTKKGSKLNVLAISADNIKKLGYERLPHDVRWITMIYFPKES